MAETPSSRSGEGRQVALTWGDLAPSPLVGEGWGEGGNRPAADTLPPYRVIAGIKPGRATGMDEAGVGRGLIGIVTDSFNNKQT